jgi:hypothetical protein
MKQLWLKGYSPWQAGVGMAVIEGAFLAFDGKIGGENVRIRIGGAPDHIGFSKIVSGWHPAPEISTGEMVSLKQ